MWQGPKVAKESDGEKNKRRNGGKGRNCYFLWGTARRREGTKEDDKFGGKKKGKTAAKAWGCDEWESKENQKRK